jgi:hypothetical protein
MTLEKLELRSDEWLNDPPGYVHRHGWPGPVRRAPWGDLIVGSRELISSLGKAPWRACSIEYSELRGDRLRAGLGDRPENLVVR